MIDLCIDARMAFCSGIGTCIREIVPLLDQKKFRIRVLVSQLGANWCKNIEEIYFPAPIYSIQEQILYPIYVPKTDLFWSPHYNAPFLPIRAKKRVVTIHDTCHLSLKTYFSYAKRVCARFVMKAAFKWADAVVTTSQFSKQELEKHLGSDQQNISIISPGVNAAKFRSTIVQDLFQTDSLPSQFILFVGNVKPHKNIERLIEAFLSIQDSICSKMALVIVGKNKQSIQTKRDSRIVFLGDVTDSMLQNLYQQASLFVFPSLYEGFGLPPLEAMSVGCPTVVSNCASIPEVCQDASFYIDPYNLQSIQQGILEVLKNVNLKQQLIAKGFERVNALTWTATAAQYSELFERIHVA